MPNHKMPLSVKVNSYEMPPAHHFPGGWAFFSSIVTYFDGSEEWLYVGAFFTIANTDGIIYVNEYSHSEDNDVPLTAMLIPY